MLDLDQGIYLSSRLVSWNLGYEDPLIENPLGRMFVKHFFYPLQTQNILSVMCFFDDPIS